MEWVVWERERGVVLGRPGKAARRNEFSSETEGNEGASPANTQEQSIPGRETEQAKILKWADARCVREAPAAMRLE